MVSLSDRCGDSRRFKPAATLAASGSRTVWQ